MYEIKTEIEIASTPEHLWKILTDFSAYPLWNPFIRSIKGGVCIKEKLTVFVQPSGGKGMTFRPTVLVAEPHKEIRWLGHLFVPGLFDGEHYFQIEAVTPGRVRLIHGEKFSGILVTFAQSSLEGGTKAGFIAMNEALKTRAETASD